MSDVRSGNDYMSAFALASMSDMLYNLHCDGHHDCAFDICFTMMNAGQKSVAHDEAAINKGPIFAVCRVHRVTYAIEYNAKNERIEVVNAFEVIAIAEGEALHG